MMKNKNFPIIVLIYLLALLSCENSNGKKARDSQQSDELLNDFKKSEESDFIREVSCAEHVELIKPDLDLTSEEKVNRVLQEPDHFRCGYVKVPIKHQDTSNTKTIEVGFTVYRPGGIKESKLPPIVIEQGGPGSDSLSLLLYHKHLIDQIEYQGFVVAIEQRGSQLSRPVLRCSETMERYNIYHNFLRDPRFSYQEQLDYDSACLEEIKRREVDYRAYNVKEIASDVAFSLEKLGFKRFHFLGISFGSTVGQYLAADHAAHLVSNTMVAAIPSGKDFNKLAVENYPHTIKKLLAVCQDSVPCVAELFSPQKTYDEMIEAYRKDPKLFTFEFDNVSIPEEADASLIERSILDKLYKNENFSDIVRIISELSGGSIEGLQSWLNVPETKRRAHQMYFPVTCAMTWNEMNGESESNMDDPRYQEYKLLFNACQHLDVEQTPLPKVSSSYDVPSFIFSGSFDPIAPPSFGSEMAQLISGSRHQLFKDQGHGIYASHRCYVDYFEKFFKDPSFHRNWTCAINKSEENIFDYGLEKMMTASWAPDDFYTPLGFNLRKEGQYFEAKEAITMESYVASPDLHHRDLLAKLMNGEKATKVTYKNAFDDYKWQMSEFRGSDLLDNEPLHYLIVSMTSDTLTLQISFSKSDAFEKDFKDRILEEIAGYYDRQRQKRLFDHLKKLTFEQGSSQSRSFGVE